MQNLKAPKEGINKEYKDFSPNFSVKIQVLKLRFLSFPGGPGGFREVREAGRNHFHLSWYLLVPGRVPKKLGPSCRAPYKCPFRPTNRFKN